MTDTNETPADYDAGLLGTGGGGDIGWWQDYIRMLLRQANEQWRGEYEALQVCAAHAPADHIPTEAIHRVIDGYPPRHSCPWCLSGGEGPIGTHDDDCPMGEIERWLESVESRTPADQSAELELLRASNAGLVSQLLDVQQDCIAMQKQRDGLLAFQGKVYKMLQTADFVKPVEGSEVFARVVVGVEALTVDDDRLRATNYGETADEVLFSVSVPIWMCYSNPEAVGTPGPKPAEIGRVTKQRDELLAAQSWRPMETAPKKGEVILRVEYRAGIPDCMLVGHWMAGGHCIEDHPPIDAGWYFWNGCMFDKSSKPTHWMPLPEVDANATPDTKVAEEVKP